jgi:hypothetical protein
MALASRQDIPEPVFPPPAHQPGAERYILFTHKDLSQEHVAFTRAPDRTAVIAFDFGTTRGVMTIPELFEYLKLDLNHPDHDTLGLVNHVLNFRREVKNGDVCPTELITGKPSWTPPARSVAEAGRQFLRGLAGQAGMILETDVIHSEEAEKAASFFAGNLLDSLPDDQFEKLRRLSRVDDIAFPAHITDAVIDMARVDAMLNVISGFQRLVGEIASFAVSNSGSRQGQVARDVVYSLRKPNLWASERGMRLQTNSQRQTEFITSDDFLYARIWPALRCLYSLKLDIEPVSALWTRASGRINGTTLGDLDELAALTKARFGNFDPGRYDIAPSAPESDPFIALEF